MKKKIFLFILVVAVAMISFYKQSAHNEMAEKNAKRATPKDFKRINKSDVGESKAGLESFTPNKVSEGSPRLLHILKNDTGLALWSPSLWWSNQYTNSRKTGC